MCDINLGRGYGTPKDAMTAFVQRRSFRQEGPLRRAFGAP